MMTILVVTNSLLGNLTSVKYIVILCNLKISTFKLTICLFYPMTTSLIFCIVCVCVSVRVRVRMYYMLYFLVSMV